MGMLGSVVLMMLGALSISSVIAKYRPSLRFWLDLMVPFQGQLGVGAALYGLYLIIRMVAYLGFIRYAPLVLLAGLSAGVVSLALGTIFGFETARGFLAPRLSGGVMGFLEGVHKNLLPYKQPLGYAALFLGAFGILINFFV